jgi:glutamate transport system permease protein
VIRRLDQHGQWAAAKWRPFAQASVWTDFLLPGLLQTLRAAAVGMALALTLGLLLAAGRLSRRRWVALPVGTVVQFLRAVPLLLMIFFVFYGLPFLIQGPVPAFWAVVVGLALYNGSVLAEALRAGILSVPRGQSDAGYALGLRASQVLRHVLLPQAARAMLPVIVSQLVVLLKDTALGYIIAYPELLQRASEVTANRGNLVAVYLVVAAMYIAVNATLSRVAARLAAGGHCSRLKISPPSVLTGPQD